MVAISSAIIDDDDDDDVDDDAARGLSVTTLHHVVDLFVGCGSINTL